MFAVQHSVDFKHGVVAGLCRGRGRYVIAPRPAHYLHQPLMDKRDGHVTFDLARSDVNRGCMGGLITWPACWVCAATLRISRHNTCVWHLYNVGRRCTNVLCLLDNDTSAWDGGVPSYHRKRSVCLSTSSWPLLALTRTDKSSVLQ